jgi:peptidyl-prolyl cis-trans isomerase SurA
MKALALLITLISIPFYQILCQKHDPDREVIMTIAGRDVEAGEFIRMYKKSLEPGNKSNPDSYLEQFVNYKLKVADAISIGYDTTKAFHDELNGYRKQLAQNYLTDPDIREELLKKAYARSLTEVNASHILVNCRPDAKPEDTLKAYQKAIDIRQRIVAGEAFDKVAKETSDDKSVSANGGNLGYFTVFQMIAQFEETAYSLQPGGVSMPVRTPFGYHIIKVIDRRPSKGKIRVAHIMKVIPPGSDENRIMKQKQAADSIYQLLKNGASFRELASKLSDHKQSAARGGELDWFGAGEIIPDFSEAAFSIKDTGEFTAPVKTIYGYHIIKLLDKKPPLTFEESRPYLESKLNQSDLASLGKKSFVEKLKKEYDFKVNKAIYQWFVNNTDSMILRGKAGYKPDKIPQRNIYSYADQHLTAKDFALLLESKGRSLNTGSVKKFIDSGIESFSADQLTNYEDSNLERKYPDFRYLMNEFHDGILLFDVSSEKIWNNVQSDSAGLHNYYIAHKNDSLSTGVNGSASDSAASYEIQADLITKYQDWLTEEWLKELKARFPVKIDNAVLEAVKKRLRNE